MVIIIKDIENSSILPPQWPSKNKIDNNKITTIMIKSLFRFKKLRDVKTGSEYTGKKGNPIYNDI